MAISIGQLDLEALKNYLKIVHGFRTVDDLSGDTEKVAGVLADMIAQAATNDKGELLLNRKTVENAINLVKLNEDGSIAQVINGDNILTDEEGKMLKDSAVKAVNNTADDMRSLRNEMYHLKRNMIKSGSMTFDQVYNGFIDPFISNLELFTADTLTITEKYGNRFTVSGDISTYKPSQYCAIYDDAKNLMIVDKVKKIESTSLEIESGAYTSNEAPKSITKSFGLYESSRFFFGSNQATNLDTAKVTNMIVKDGSDRVKVAEINEASGIAGFATVLSVPAALDGHFLQTMTLALRTVGSPGGLHIEIYDFNSNMLYGNAIAMSNNLNGGLVSTEWRNYEFTFNNQLKLEKGHEYLVVVKATGTSSGNVWSLGGFIEVCNNLLHQDTWRYTVDGGYMLEGPDMITNKIADLFIGIGTTVKQEMGLSPSRYGLYTGSFNIENDLATRCRVSINPRLDSNIDKYQVIVKGSKLDDKGEMKDVEFAKFNGRSLFKHNVWANGVRSAYEYCYDFSFSQAVDFIEFQILFDNGKNATADDYEALYSVVVSTDNAYIEKYI